MAFDSSDSRIKVAMSGSRCPRVDPSSANLNADKLQAAQEREAGSVLAFA